jgi:hypothetical protein
MKSGEHHLSLGRPCIAINFFPQLKSPGAVCCLFNQHTAKARLRLPQILKSKIKQYALPTV